MKTNHRDGTKKRKDGKSRWAVPGAAKAQARLGRRSAERVYLHRIRTESVDPDNTTIPGRNVEVSDGLKWD